VLGLSANPPPFAKPYADLAGSVTAAIRHYAADVVAGRDPAAGPSRPVTV
jgi:ketopantoate hydroxymethyltransferase